MVKPVTFYGCIIPNSSIWLNFTFAARNFSKGCFEHGVSLVAIWCVTVFPYEWTALWYSWTFEKVCNIQLRFAEGLWTCGARWLINTIFYLPSGRRTYACWWLASIRSPHASTIGPYLLWWQISFPWNQRHFKKLNSLTFAEFMWNQFIKILHLANFLEMAWYCWIIRHSSDMSLLD